MVWPVVESQYALTAVAMAALAYVVIHVTRFMGQQTALVERISVILENHLSDVAEALEAVCDRLEKLEEKVDRMVRDGRYIG